MGAEIDRLEVQVEAQATKANNQLDKLVSNLDRVSGALSGLNSGGLAGLSNGVAKFAQASSQLSNVKTADFTRLTKNIDKLANLNTQQIYGAASSMRTLSTAINSLGGVSANSLQVAEVANSISKLGGSNVQRAIANLPALATAMNKFMATMAKAPQVSKNIIDMTNALANLASQGAKVGTAGNSLVTSTNRIGTAMEKTKKKTRSFSSVLGSLYQTYFWVSRAGSKLWDSVKDSMGYVEVYNYFDKAFGQVADSAVGQWEDAGADSAQAYYNSFSERAKQLTTKMTGFTIADNGMLESAGGKSLGINPSTLMNYQAMFAQMSNSMGVTAETSLKLSTALTEIGADLASVKNMDFDKVWKDMASGLAGMSRTLDKYGANIRNVNLQQKLTELGINANISALNQNEKALLRTIILLDSTRYAWGDLAETIDQPANQLRLLQANFGNLARTIGNIFLPIVAKILPYINALVIALQRLAEWIVKLLGFEDFDWGGSSGTGGSNFDDLLGGIGDVEDGLNDATGAAKKLKTHLLGIDELNVVNNDEDSNGIGIGGLGGYGGLLEGALDKILDEYQSAWDEAFAKLESRAQEIADKIQEYALKVWNFIQPFIQALLKFWEAFSKVIEFVKIAFKDFYENFLVPLAEWAFGTEDKGITAFLNTLTDLINSIDWEGINEALKKLWIALEPFVEKIGDGLNWFFREVLSPFAQFLANSVLIDTIEALADALDALNVIIEKLTPIAKEFWEVFGKDEYANILDKIHQSVDAILSPFSSLKDLLDDFSWDNFLKYAEDVADFALLLSNPMGWFATRKKSNESQEGHQSATDNKFGGAGSDRGYSGSFAKSLENLKKEFNQFFEDIGAKAITFFDDLYANKLQEFVSNSSTKFSEWYTNSVSPWFTEEKWSELYQNILTSLETKWGELAKWWSESAVAKWWTDNVQPWFTTEKWNELYSVINSELENTWDELVDWWTTSGIYRWYNDNVKTWFSKEKWTFSGIKDGLKLAWENAIESIKSVWNTFANWFNSKMTLTIPAIEIGGETIFAGKSIEFIKLPTFQTGGFPEDGLFMANHSELVGRFSNGKTAVANNEQIIAGITRGVAQANSEEVALLNEAVGILTEIVSAVREGKSITIDGRELVEAYDERKARNGYVF